MLTSRKQDYEQKINRSLNMAKLFYQNKDYNQAKEFVTELLNLKPDSSDAHKLLSQINEALGEHDLAIKNYRKSLELKTANNSLDNSFSLESVRLTPIKNNRSFINSNHSTPNNQSMNNVNYDVNISETVEKLLDSKLSPLVAKLENNIKQNLDFSYTLIQKNNEEISAVKKKVTDVHKKVNLMLTKMEELVLKISEIPPTPPPQVTKQDIVKLNSSLNKLQDRFGFLNNDLNVKFDELTSKVNYLIDCRENADDEEEYDEDYTSHSIEFNQSIEKSNVKPPELSTFIKKGGWTCTTCTTSNADSDTRCLACEEPNPNGPLVANSTDAKPSFTFGFNTTTTNQNSLSQTALSQECSAGNLQPSKTPSTNVGPVSTTPSLFGFSAPQNTTAIPKTQPTVFGTISQPSFAASSAYGTSLFGSTPSSLFNAPSTPNQAVNPSQIQSPFSNFASMISQEPSGAYNGIATPTFTLPNTSPSQGLDSFKFGGTPPSFSLGPKTTASTLTTTTTSSLPSSSPASTFSFTNLANSLPSKPLFGTPPAQSLDFSNIFKTNPASNNLFNTMSSPNSSNVEKQEPKESEPDKSSDGEHNESNDLILPKVNLPENYEHITGEEEETELYSNRAKLYIYDSEYKERGLGVLKILKSNKTGKIRVLMRRDTVLKVCLNAYITSFDKFEIKGKFLSFQCLDFSDEKPNPGTYLLKLSNLEALQEFENTVKSLKETPNAVVSLSDQNKPVLKEAVSHPEKKQAESVDKDIEIVFVKEPTLPEHIKKVAELRLPINFFDYENKSSCKGCIGCRVDELSWNELTYEKTEQPIANGIGLFSNLATDIPQNKTDTIDTGNVGALPTEADTPDYVSEKSKLLPVSYEHKTGEEEETAIYEQRAKLFRFDEKTLEYKERGVGQIRILKHNSKNQFRLLMRRDVVFKTICNHLIYPKLNLTVKSPNKCLWGTMDYSENTSGEKVIFLLKVMNEPIMKEFLDAVHKCIAELSPTKENN